MVFNLFGNFNSVPSLKSTGRAFTKDNKLQLYQGTSMAAPIASAVIGNVFAKEVAVEKKIPC